MPSFVSIDVGHVIQPTPSFFWLLPLAIHHAIKPLGLGTPPHLNLLADLRCRRLVDLGSVLLGRLVLGFALSNGRAIGLLGGSPTARRTLSPGVSQSEPCWGVLGSRAPLCANGRRLPNDWAGRHWWA